MADVIFFDVQKVRFRKCPNFVSGNCVHQRTEHSGQGLPTASAKFQKHKHMFEI
jgi:hypothetical protein